MNRIPCLFMLGSIYSNYLGRKCRDGEIVLHTNLLLKLGSLCLHLSRILKQCLRSDKWTAKRILLFKHRVPRALQNQGKQEVHLHTFSEIAELKT